MRLSPAVRASICASSLQQTPSFEVAPMMAHTHRDFRYFWRLISEESVLWTEMISARDVALLSDEDLERKWGLGCASKEKVVCQLGGADPKTLAGAAERLRGLGYDQFNLNVGCPSQKVATEGRFGAALMRDPKLVAECCAAIGPRTSVKHRLAAVDGSDYETWDYERTRDAAFAFVDALTDVVSRFVVHARIAVLADEDEPVPKRIDRREELKRAKHRRLTTMANRQVPPLRYDIARELKRSFPSCEFVLNGGLTSIDTARAAVGSSTDGALAVDGAMVGRALVSHPCAFADLDARWYGASTRTTTRGEVLDRYIAYVEETRQRTSQEELVRVVAVPYRLFNGEPRSGAYMRRIKNLANTKLKKGVLSPANLLRAAKAELDPETLYDKPLTDCTPITDLAAYDLEVPRAGPLARLVV
mmetsp:Transcript_25616/g.78796  ORF Transcript_25616/g.78796 Transcript_25616/m.78796 type:complete len:418 (-) Transcript_25616:109-1362(-)